MNVLDSNVEALAINYLSFGVLTALNNLWTWLALLTAALSFWKIRSVGCPRPTKPESKPEPKPEAQSFLEPGPSEVMVEEQPVKLTVGKGVAEDIDGVRKGKFTVYYEEDMQCMCSDNKRDGFLTALEEREREGYETEWWKKWEGLLRLRNGEENKHGWYTWQDLTELNGNVVKLWDGEESWYNNNSNCINVW
ncbi:hypothetical protein Fmac_016323 [Flemingia macrophylla]|uniref:Transmembrane protein n=1 Tax=Flemingia macrophylla TaxID=520843 RepID=A0ABD1MH44_9FABA